jgi:hypothetical protein
MHSKSTKNFFRVNDPVIDELATKLRQTPDRVEQRVIAKKIVDREYDQILRMWMPYDSGSLVRRTLMLSGRGERIRASGPFEHVVMRIEAGPIDEGVSF